MKGITKCKWLVAVFFMIAALAMTTYGVVLAASYNSPSQIAGTGPNTLNWTGQGATNGVLNSTQCDASQTPSGIANEAYLHWIFTDDGGRTTDDNDEPTLILGGSAPATSVENVVGLGGFHFNTLYYTPDSNLTAYVDFNTIKTGNGNYVLTISHGCSGETEPVCGNGITEAPEVCDDGVNNGNPGFCNLDCTAVLPNPDSTETVTEIHNSSDDSAVSSSVALASTVHDKATVTNTGSGGNGTPEGNVAFRFYTGGSAQTDCQDDPNGTSGSDAGTVAVDGTGVAHPSNDQACLHAGTDYFKAFYTSSNTDKWLDSSSSCESVTVDKGNPSVVTLVHRWQAANNHEVFTTIAVGQLVHDKATVTGITTSCSGFDPTGTVDFTLTDSNNCTGIVADSDAGVTLSSGVAESCDPGTGCSDSANSFTLTANEVPDASYQATYNGNDDYNSAGAACEPFHVELRTMGYYKTHLGLGLSPSQTLGAFVQPYAPPGNLTPTVGYLVDTNAREKAVFDKANCSSNKPNDAVGCLAGQLLAAELNVTVWSATPGACIASGNTFLTGIFYIGPTGNYSGISAADRASAITLKTALDNYNHGFGC